MKIVRYKKLAEYLGTLVDSSHLSIGFIHAYRLDAKTAGLWGEVKKGRACFFIDEIKKHCLTILGRELEGVVDMGIEEIDGNEGIERLKKQVRTIEKNSKEIK